MISSTVPFIRFDAELKRLLYNIEYAEIFPSMREIVLKIDGQ